MELNVARTAGLTAGLTALLMLGCGEAPPDPPPVMAFRPGAIGERFDAATAGSIRGRVVWSGPVPDVPPFEVRSLVSATNPGHARELWANPHRPVVAAGTQRVVGAVVFLRAVDPQFSRPWDHGLACVEHVDRRLEIVQGGQRAGTGFVRRGDKVRFVSHEKLFNSLQARGAGFFSLTFPDAAQPLERPLAEKGLVELTSGAGWYWMRAYLFVADHPYFARTDSNGNFELCAVPPGRYRIVCWMPNWHIARQERDPESGLVVRIVFQAPLDLEREVIVETGGSVTIDFTIQADLFKR